jgi:hypothetical protein
MSGLALTTWSATASVLFAGLLAGTEIAVRLGVAGPLELLDRRAHIVVRQGLIRTLRVIAPAFFFPALILGGIAAACGERSGMATAWRAVGVAALVVWLLVTFAGTVPLNSAAMEWDPLNPPPDFQEIIRRWERLAAIRVVASVVAFASFTLAQAVATR